MKKRDEILDIYRITNDLNGKVYIGQSKNPVTDRFKRHLQDAKSGRLNTHLARAIRKYGEGHFHVDVIDSAKTQEELNLKEQFWIRKYDSVNTGYNETDALYKCGGNTYKSKSKEEMDIIRKKISETKFGKDNPRSRSIKCLNRITGQELFFDSLAQARDYFGETNHNFITRRVMNKITYLYKGEWSIAYSDEPYNENYSTEKNIRKSVRIHVKNLETGIENDFISFSAAERFFGLKNKSFTNKRDKTKNHFIIQNIYEITVLE